MARHWPQFNALPGFGPRSVIWYGDVKGLDRLFHISIKYGLPLPGRLDRYRMMPEVRVLEPSLIPNWSAEQESPLPHVYFEPSDIRQSPLCLFDPKAGEWDHSVFISRTTVVWTVRWLAAYEFWEMTGRWIGGGRHDENGNEKGEGNAS